LHQSFGTGDEITLAIEKHADMVRRICFLYLKSQADVEDVFQEVFLKFFLHFDSLQNEDYQRKWLCRVTFNQCKDLCRCFWRNRVVNLEEVDLLYEDPEQGELLKAILGLPLDQRQLIYLHYVEGRTIPEVSEIMGRNSNTIYSLLRRAKIRLKKVVGEIE